MLKNRLTKLINRRIFRQHDQPQGSDFSQIYQSWELAKCNSDGWDSPCILEKVRSGVIEVLEGNCEYERDGTPFSERPHVNTLRRLMASLITTGSWIIDFGGGLGGTYVNNRDIMPNELSFDIIEQPLFCHAGELLSQEFGLPLHYAETLEEVKRDGRRLDLIIFSGVLSYLDTWDQVIDAALALKPRHIIVDRQILSPEQSYICVQKVQNYYEREISYPLRVFSIDQFVDNFPGYGLQESWHSDFDPPNHHGFHFLRNESG